VLAKMGPIVALPNKLYSILNDVELKLPYVKDSDGRDVIVSHGRYRSALYHPDRKYRERVYNGIYEGFASNINSFEALYNGRVASRIALANIRKYPSALEASLHENNIPLDIFNNLIKTVQRNVKTLHR
jgi:oligoendopeptidase F